MNVIRHHEGTALQVLGDEVTIKLASAHSPHGQAIVTVQVPPGSGTPCVTHAVEEEVYFVIEGELLMHTPTERHALQAGDMVHLPPLTPHGYRNPGQRPTRFLAWTVGGPMDRFFVKMAERVHQLPQDLPAMQAVMAEHGVVRVV
jgi:mannose-6-phosphate isomerase-like protein (cupin superfamily)